MPTISDPNVVKAIAPLYNITAEMITRQEKHWEKVHKETMTDIFKALLDAS